MVLGRDGGHLFDLIMIRKVKSWSSCQGGKGLGCVERSEHLKQLEWTGWEGGLLGESEEEVIFCLPRNQAPVPTPKSISTFREHLDPF